jgi:hypothetical protein
VVIIRAGETLNLPVPDLFLQTGEILKIGVPVGVEVGKITAVVFVDRWITLQLAAQQREAGVEAVGWRRAQKTAKYSVVTTPLRSKFIRPGACRSANHS